MRGDLPVGHCLGMAIHTEVVQMPDTPNAVTDESQVVVFLGTSNRILARREQTDGSISAVEITVAPGAGSPLHTNTREALTWCIVDGTLTFRRGDRHVEVGAGEVIFMPKGDTHAFANRGERPAKALLLCTPGGFEGFLVELGAVLPPEAPTGPPSREVRHAITEIGDRYGVQHHVS